MTLLAIYTGVFLLGVLLGVAVCVRIGMTRVAEQIIPVRFHQLTQDTQGRDALLAAARADTIAALDEQPLPHPRNNGRRPA